jgi:hypothetical protein
MTMFRIVKPGPNGLVYYKAPIMFPVFTGGEQCAKYFLTKTAANSIVRRIHKSWQNTQESYRPPSSPIEQSQIQEISTDIKEIHEVSL